jgi:VWFA-related protein
MTPQAQVVPQPPPDTAGQMTLHVTVDAHSGKSVEGLTAADFTLLDNKKPQPITSFRALKNQPTRIVVVLDAVNLPYTEVSFARQQLSQFFSANGGKLAQPMTLGVLQDTGLQIQPAFTTDGNALRSSLDHFTIGLRELPRSTGVYGAEERMQISLTTMKALIAQLPKNGPKRIIWVSAGWPLLSGPAVELNPSKRAQIFSDLVGLVTEMRKSQITIDAVNPLGASQDVATTDYYENFMRTPRNFHDVELGNLGLQLLAIDSGGLVLNGSNDIANLLQRAVQQTEECYEISFAPSPGERENEYHELQLKVNRSGLTVHTTAGYYAQPVYPPLERPRLTPAS